MGLTEVPSTDRTSEDNVIAPSANELLDTAKHGVESVLNGESTIFNTIMQGISAQNIYDLVTSEEMLKRHSITSYFYNKELFSFVKPLFSAEQFQYEEPSKQEYTEQQNEKPLFFKQQREDQRQRWFLAETGNRAVLIAPWEQSTGDNSSVILIAKILGSNEVQSGAWANIPKEKAPLHSFKKAPIDNSSISI